MGRIAAHIDEASPRRILIYLGGVFAAFHAVLYALGVYFDTAPLGMYCHYADPEWLRTRLLETCFYLHVQPPLYNLFLGAVLKLFPHGEVWAFHALFLLNGFALYVLLVALQARLGVSKTLAIILSTLFMCSPSFVLFEHLLVYTLQCAFLLCLAAWLLHEFLKKKRAWAGWGFFITLFLLGGIRSMYHLVYYMIVAAAFVALAGPPRRKLVWMAVVPGLLLFSFYAKNYVLFDKFTVSTFFGKSPWTKVVGNLSWDQRVRLVEDKKLSEVSLIERWWATRYYPPGFQEAEGFDSIPVLREMYRPSVGEVNYNYLAQIAITDAYLKDAVYVTRHYPRVFLCTTAWSGLNYASPTPCPLGRLSWLNALYERVFYGKVNVRLSRYIPQLGASKHVPYVFLLLGLPFVFCYGLWLALPLKRARACANEQRVVILFMCFTILFVGAAGVLFELNDTSRYRFETDPFYVALLGLFIQREVVCRLRRNLKSN